MIHVTIVMCPRQSYSTARIHVAILIGHVGIVSAHVIVSAHGMEVACSYPWCLQHNKLVVVCML